MYVVDRERKVALIKNDSVVTRHLRFNGKVLAGLRVIFWGNVEGKEVCLGKGCVVMGDVICERAVIGAFTKFNRIIAEDSVLIQSKCLGRYVKAKNVRIAEKCLILEVEAEEGIFIDGNSKIRRLNAKKILAFGDSERMRGKAEKT